MQPEKKHTGHPCQHRTPDSPVAAHSKQAYHAHEAKHPIRQTSPQYSPVASPFELNKARDQQEEEQQTYQHHVQHRHPLHPVAPGVSSRKVQLHLFGSQQRQQKVQQGRLRQHCCQHTEDQDERQLLILGYFEIEIAKPCQHEARQREHTQQADPQKDRIRSPCRRPVHRQHVCISQHHKLIDETHCQYDRQQQIALKEPSALRMPPEEQQHKHGCKNDGSQWCHQCRQGCEDIAHGTPKSRRCLQRTQHSDPQQQLRDCRPVVGSRLLKRSQQHWRSRHCQQAQQAHRLSEYGR